MCLVPRLVGSASGGKAASRQANLRTRKARSGFAKAIIASNRCWRLHGALKCRQVEVVDADFGGHELVKERAEESLKSCKLTLTHPPHAIGLINRANDLVLLN